MSCIFLQCHISEVLARILTETFIQTYKPVLKIVEANRDFKKMSEIHKKLHLAFEKINDLQGRRVFGTYFRSVAFNILTTFILILTGLAFTVKGLETLMEKSLCTRSRCWPSCLRSSAGWTVVRSKPLVLVEFPTFRLESFYSNKYGADNLIIITDSKQVTRHYSI